MAAQIDPNSIVEPPAVVKALQRGWDKHIPLHLLSNNKSRSGLFVEASDLQSITLESGRLRIQQSSLDSSGESTMSLSDFMEAHPRLCNMIEQYLPGPDSRAIAGLWRMHYAYIIGRSDFAGKFRHYLAYDIRLRQHYVNHSDTFSPAHFQTGIWDDIMDQWRTSQILSFQSSLDRFSSDFRAQPQSSYVRGNSFRDHNSGPASLPAQSNAFSSRKKVIKGPSATSNSPQGVCFICRSPEHIGRFCKCVTNGFLSRSSSTNGAPWKGPNDLSVCFKFNITSGCGSSNCSFSHVCSCCGHNDHNAQTHN